MQKKEYRRNIFYSVSLVFTLLFLNLGCQREDLNGPLASTYSIKTVSKSDAFTYLNSQLVTARNSNETYITQMGDSIIYDPLINSDELIATLTVSTIHDKAYSRVLLLEINDSLQSVVFSMYSSNDFSSENFSGSALVIDLQGNVMGGFKVENGLYVSQYVFPENFDLYQTASRSTGGDDYVWDDGSLDEIVITTQSSNIRIMYVYYPHLINTDTNPESTAEEPTWTSGGGSSGQTACPPGYVKDDNNNCVPQCPEDEVWVESLQQCAPKCDDGFVRDIQGNCVKKPCEGDSVYNPMLAAQKGKSGIIGATFGCTRYGGGCVSSDGRNKMHGGIDILNERNSPLFAMFDGKVISKYYQPDGAGHALRIRSELPNGEIIIYQYFHLKENSMLPNNTEVKAGDIIGIQGDSGNLRGAIASGGVDSHVHIRINTYGGSGDTYDYNNFKNQLVNPNDYIKTKFDENGNIIENNCD